MERVEAEVESRLGGWLFRVASAVLVLRRESGESLFSFLFCLEGRG